LFVADRKHAVERQIVESERHLEFRGRLGCLRGTRKNERTG
jgi:hypothetical protein